MKRLMVLLLALVMVTGLLAGCGGSGSSAPAGSTPPAGGSSTGAGSSAPAQADPPSVALIAGNVSDKSFNESAANGVRLVESMYGCKTNIVEYGSDETKILPTLEDLSGEWDIIIAIGYQSAEHIEAVAAAYPDQKYVLLDTQVDYADGKNANVYSASYKGNEGAFLAGALATMVTTSEDMPHADPSNKMIGFVGGMDMTLINDFVLGYIQGARYVDEEVKVMTAYTASWTDAAKGKEIGKTMFDAGCDVVYNGAGGSGLGALDAGKDAQRYSIGTDSDQSLLFEDDPDKANLILTSQLKSLDQNIVLIVERYMAGEEVFGKGETLGVKEGIICLAENEYYLKNVPQDIRDAVSELVEKISSGEIEVDTAYGMDEADVKEIINGARP